MSEIGGLVESRYWMKACATFANIMSVCVSPYSVNQTRRMQLSVDSKCLCVCVCACVSPCLAGSLG